MANNYRQLGNLASLADCAELERDLARLRRDMASSVTHYTFGPKVAILERLYSVRHYMANWPQALNSEEKQQLEDIRAARARLKARDKEYTARIMKLMNRGIRRLRRAEGKK